jgi:hypothetical protein
MSWQEIYGLTMELEEIKTILRNEYGISIKGNKKSVNLETEIENLKSLVMNIMNENSHLKKEMEKMGLNLDRLAEEVARVTTVHASAMSLLRKLTGELEGVSAQLAAQAAQTPPVLDTAPLDALIDQLKASTDTLAGAVADSADVKDVVEVVLNADDPTKATVSVVMPEVMPEHVEVVTEMLVDTVDVASDEPQVLVTVVEAAEPVADAVGATVSTPDDQVDVTVSADADMHAEVLADTGVDVVEAVKEAFESTEEVVAAPVADEEPKTE